MSTIKSARHGLPSRPEGLRLVGAAASGGLELEPGAAGQPQAAGRARLGVVDAQGDVLVTRHLILKNEKTEAGQRPLSPWPWPGPWRLDTEPEPFFVDWLSLHQQHPAPIARLDGGRDWITQGGRTVLGWRFDGGRLVDQWREVNDGTVMGVDSDGELVWKTVRQHQIRGSHDTSVAIRSDGCSVWFSGNVSRFGRSNNLFGFGLEECIRRVNELLSQLGLPAFTMGRKGWRQRSAQDNGKWGEGDTGRTGFDLVETWSGARISRIDLTANYETGSLSDARAYMEWLATQQSARVKVGTHADGETVDWGRGSRRIYSKVYLKSEEMRRHGAPDDLIKYCEKVGLLRFELTAKSTQLIAMGCQYLGSFNMAQIVELFENRRAVMTRAERTVDDLSELPKTLRGTARDYLAGDDIRANMSQATFYRHRVALLPYGIDIAVKRNVVDFKPRVRVIEVRPASVPSWYSFDSERKFA